MIVEHYEDLAAAAVQCCACHMIFTFPSLIVIETDFDLADRSIDICIKVIVILDFGRQANIVFSSCLRLFFGLFTAAIGF